MTRLGLIPLDDRPVNYDHPRLLGKAAGIEVVTPPRAWLGNPWHQADTEGIRGWLAEMLPGLDGLVASIDTLAYGGLVPSRRSASSFGEAMRWLEPLRAAKEVRPDLSILAYNVLMRVNRADDAEEEKPYFATHGRRLFRLSYLDDKCGLGEACPAEDAERSELATEVPVEIVADYRAGRARNHAVNRAMLGWAAEGILDYLVIPQDDTVEYGWNVAEARDLRRLVETEGIADRAAVYPGADEVGSLLVARWACRRAGFAPRVWTRYSTVGGPGATTAYEDRPLEEQLKAHLGPLGGSLAGAPTDADLVLAINAPAGAQADAFWQALMAGPVLGAEPPQVPADLASEALRSGPARATGREMASVARNLDEFVRAICADVAAGRPVGVVDVAFVNGADLALADRLMRVAPVAHLAAFGAWNTAGNTLGAALAQAAVRSLALRQGGDLAQLAAHLDLLLLHLVDDASYQGLERTRLMFSDLPAIGESPTFGRLSPAALSRVEAALGPRLEAQAEAWGRRFVGEAVPMGSGAQATVTGVRIAPPRLPWGRLFEVDVVPHVELA